MKKVMMLVCVLSLAAGAYAQGSPYWDVQIMTVGSSSLSATTKTAKAAEPVISDQELEAAVRDYIKVSQLAEFEKADQKLDELAKTYPEYATLLADVKKAHRRLLEAFNLKEPASLPEDNEQDILLKTEAAGRYLEPRLTDIEEKDIETGKQVLPLVEEILKHKYPYYQADNGSPMSLQKTVQNIVFLTPTTLQNAGLFLENLCYADRIAQVGKENPAFTATEEALKSLAKNYPGHVAVLKEVRGAHRDLAFAFREESSAASMLSEVRRVEMKLTKAIKNIDDASLKEIVKTMLNHKYKFNGQKERISLSDAIVQTFKSSPNTPKSDFFADVVRVGQLAKNSPQYYWAESALNTVMIETPAYREVLLNIKSAHRDILEALNIQRERAEFEEHAILERLEDIGPSLDAQLNSIGDVHLRSFVKALLDHKYQFRGTQVIPFHEVLQQVAGFFNTQTQWGQFFDELQAKNK